MRTVLIEIIGKAQEQQDQQEQQDPSERSVHYHIVSSFLDTDV